MGEFKMIYSQEELNQLGDDVKALNGLGLPSERLKVKSLRENSRQVPNNKYHATRTEYNGNLYHSKKEAEYAQGLDLLIKAGEIEFYLRQVPFQLQGGVVYRADFVTFQRLPNTIWNIKVIEVKGYFTPESKRKMKQFRAAYPNLEIEIV
jgi:hypothetical protein